MNNNDTKIKLAWQAAFEQRTCPPEAILFAETVDSRLNAHLAVCHLCREKRDMPLVEREAWQLLREKFRGSVMQPGLPPKVAGQVWVLAGTLAGWSEDNHYYRPPTVVLLEKTEGTSGWRVAQLHGDKCLMGSGDVALDEKYGFAQGWNCYTLHEKNFEKCLGVVKADNFAQIQEASVARHELAEEGSILSFFRKLEIEVGAYVAVPSVMELVAEWEAAHAEERELVPGLTAIISGAKEFGLRITGAALDILQGTFAPSPALVTRGEDASKPEQKAAVLSEEDQNLLRQNLPLIPVDFGMYADGYRVYFRVLAEMSQEPPVLSVLVDGEPIVDSRWEKWGTKAPYICCGARMPALLEIKVDDFVFKLCL